MLRRSLIAALFSLFTITASAEPIRPVVAGFHPPAADSALDEQILDRIKTIGWYHVQVEAEGQKPAFAYSLGFYANFGQPEVVVFGLPMEISQRFLDIAAIRIAGAKQPYEMYKPYEDIAEGTKVAFVPVARRHFPAYFGYGGWFYQSVETDFPVIQMVWPDKAGKFPWEQGYDKRYLALQPLLDK